MKAWKRIEPTRVTKVGWRTVITKSFELPNGEMTTFDVLHPDGQEFADIIAITPDGKVVVARQFRPGPEAIMDEAPGGYVDEGETPEHAARRELREETGYEAGTLEYLGYYHKDPYLNGKWHVFLARDCVKKSDQELEPGEHVEVVLQEIGDWIDSGLHGRIAGHGTMLLAYEKLKQIQMEGK